jgi:hypothetical protein
MKMTVAQLKKRLEAFPDDAEVMILDGFNGGGEPRTINFGPIEHTITGENANECGDCEGKVGAEIALIGYGCY